MKSITKSKSFEIEKDDCMNCGKTRWLYDQVMCIKCHYKTLLNDCCVICKKFNIKKTEYHEISVCEFCYLKTKTK